MFAETVPNPPSKPKSYNNKNSTKVNIPVIMVDFGNSDKSSRSRWVCPSDRQLALRAKLKTGWSVKSNMPATYVKQVPSISEQEREVIKSVIKRAETIDRYDQQRVGRLAEKLENIKRCAIGNGKSECLLCAERIGFFYSKGWTCNDCNKS
ncbi:rab effector Noc2-like isoform X2 [Bacillus rossius redtenbacheri]|uniref:rab effector Noc2-like isoform X2 n=1 Tax=Bacillus rossius redtenbacheri TaxID=93214 RepID=UPI002FDD7232